MNTTTRAQPNPAKAHEYFSAKMEFTTGPIELERERKGGDVVVVDVRATEDYDKGHIPGAVSLPQDRWERPEGLDRARVNVLYCYSQVCHLAARAAVELSAQGYPVRELEGGFEGWKQNKLPVEAGELKARPPGKTDQPQKPAVRSPKQGNP